MKSPDDLEDRMTQLREAWPVDSMVENVMARIRATAPRRGRRRRLLVGLSLSGLAAAVVLALLVIINQPRTLLAAVQEGLERAQSAHVTTTYWGNHDVPYKDEIWYRRGEGLRYEAPWQVIVEDGTTQWSWSPGPGVAEPVVLRQSSPGFFTTGLLSKLALPDFRGDWARFRTPEMDRVVDGRECRGYTLSLAELEQWPPGTRAADGKERRALILAETDGRIAVVTVERRPPGGAWQREREVHIEYDVPIPAEKVAARLPAGARVVDCDQAFSSLFPLAKALHRVELGGLILAVHDLQPLKDREGFYVVSSVRGTPEFLKQYPPRRRPLNTNIMLLDVAFQPMTNRMWGAKYDIIGLGEANREGVEYRWWVIVPRHSFELKDGKRVYLPESDLSIMPGEPGRLDDLPGKARVPLAATYWDDKHRDARGVQQEVSTWAVVPVPADRPPATWEDVMARARRDLVVMGAGEVGWLCGVAADAKPDGPNLRGISRFKPDAISDADFAAAVRRGLDDLHRLDEVHMPGPEDAVPQSGGGSPKR
jgi:hypothetical protein